MANNYKYNYLSKIFYLFLSGILFLKKIKFFQTKKNKIFTKNIIINLFSMI